MNAEAVIIYVMIFSVIAGIFTARQMVERRTKKRLQERLANWSLGKKDVEQAPTLVRAAKPQGNWRISLPGSAAVANLLAQSGSSLDSVNFIMISAILFLLPFLAAFFFSLDALIAALIGSVLAVVPWIVLLIRRTMLRRKFQEQLPDAIDLMVSILKSGHSIPQAVRTVGTELTAPCGSEFSEVLHRMNLGQPLSEALTYSAEKFQSYELDLIRRAVAIQAEVGGSLAELLDKTNATLRQRLKLVRQVKTLTAQSRLTAMIVGCLPIILAVALNFINPGYLSPLVESFPGQILLAVAVVLQVFGLILMKNMSTVKV